jgi:hypothetical protein
VVYVNHPELRGFFRFEKPFDSGFLAVNGLGDPAAPVTDVATGATEERCLHWIHLALGEAIPVTVESVMHWSAAADAAERLQQGRVFLAGDAAHVMPPNGGFGGNTGVQDAHNLAWKLAMVVRGQAAVGLLATYDQERRPVGVVTTEQAYARYVTRTAPYLGTDGMEPVEPDLNVELGYCYQSAAVCADGGRPTLLHESPRASKGRPGSRAPHVWIDVRGERASTLDFFGRQFVLLAGADGHAWCEAARIASQDLGVPIDIQHLDMSLGGPDGAVVQAFGLSSTGAAIVRPDGFVGWRAEEIGPDASAGAAVGRALAKLTCSRSGGVNRTG